MTAALTGINERSAKAAGLDVDMVILSPMSHAGSYQGLTENFFKFAEFTLKIEDAQEYVYSISSTRRVKAWRDIEVKLYI